MSAERLTAIYHIRDAATGSRRAPGHRGRAERGDAGRGHRRRRSLRRHRRPRRGIARPGDGVFDVTIALAVATIGPTPASSSTCCSATPRCIPTSRSRTPSCPTAMLKAFGGPRHGLDGLRRRVGRGPGADLLGAEAAGPRRPTGSPRWRRLAQGGIDFIKDDHGLADQAYSPSPSACPASPRRCAAARRRAADPLRAEPVGRSRHDARADRDARATTASTRVMVAPMIAGVSTFQGLVREHPDMAFMAHPTHGRRRASRRRSCSGSCSACWAPMRSIFPNHGGRFGYSPETCRRLAATALRAAGRDCARRAGAGRRHDPGARARNA